MRSAFCTWAWESLVRNEDTPDHSRGLSDVVGGSRLQPGLCHVLQLRCRINQGRPECHQPWRAGAASSPGGFHDAGSWHGSALQQEAGRGTVKTPSVSKSLLRGEPLQTLESS